MTDQTKEAQAPFEWHRVSSIDEMEQFFLSRLPAIRKAAFNCGYAIALHGSLRRDFDLIAVPWVEDHADVDALARAVHLAACGLSTVYSWTEKPAGRIATSMAICWTDDSMGFDTPGLGHLDLSIMPASSGRAKSEDYRRGVEDAAEIARTHDECGTPDGETVEHAILAMLETKAELTEGQTTIRNSLDWLKANKADNPQSEVGDAVIALEGGHFVIGPLDFMKTKTGWDICLNDEAVISDPAKDALDALADILKNADQTNAIDAARAEVQP